MKTQVLPIDEASLAEARRILLSGGCVAFPTETVYGLGADARSDSAVRTIYAVKGRPSDNPLIVHVHKEYDLDGIVFDTPFAKRLREVFLPGPLTLVYKSRGTVSSVVSRVTTGRSASCARPAFPLRRLPQTGPNTSAPSRLNTSTPISTGVSR